MVVDPDIACNIMTSIGKLNSKENFSDFTVIVEGKEFRCHRFLLNACSGFFNALLRSGMKEATEHSVAVHGISSDDFSIILNCLYKGENVITRDNVIELWHAANLLQINFLVQECEKYIVDKLIPEDTHEVYAHAKLLDSNGVVKSVINLIAKDFERYSSTSIFLQLYPEDILTLVKHEELFVSSEDLVINAILKWASHCEVIEHGDNTGQRSIEDDSSREEILLDQVSHSETDSLGLDISRGCSIFDGKWLDRLHSCLIVGSASYALILTGIGKDDKYEPFIALKLRTLKNIPVNSARPRLD
ncbi:hypothetical protein Btru_009716 [Bulinus truncatus]|nr:hypothetical protein Btru_009716 [Bulinus truncatus]